MTKYNSGIKYPAWSSWCSIPDLEEEHSESDLVNLIVESLSDKFMFSREVKGKHLTGKPCKIDLVCKPRDASPWCDEDPVFGIEVKRGRRNNDPSDNIISAYAQAVDYANSTFDQYGSMKVFVLTPYCDVYGSDSVVKLAWKLGVGDMRYTYGYGWALYGGANRIWSEKDGRPHSRISMKRRFGHR